MKDRAWVKFAAIDPSPLVRWFKLGHLCLIVGGMTLIIYYYFSDKNTSEQLKQLQSLRRVRAELIFLLGEIQWRLLV
jgi:hypothetical protein